MIFTIFGKINYYNADQSKLYQSQNAQFVLKQTLNQKNFSKKEKISSKSPNILGSKYKYDINQKPSVKINEDSLHKPQYISIQSNQPKVLISDTKQNEVSSLKEELIQNKTKAINLTKKSIEQIQFSHSGLIQDHTQLISSYLSHNNKNKSIGNKEKQNQTLIQKDSQSLTYSHDNMKKRFKNAKIITNSIHSKNQPQAAKTEFPLNQNHTDQANKSKESNRNQKQIKSFNQVAKPDSNQNKDHIIKSNSVTHKQEASKKHNQNVNMKIIQIQLRPSSGLCKNTIQNKYQIGNRPKTTSADEPTNQDLNSNKTSSRGKKIVYKLDFKPYGMHQPVLNSTKKSSSSLSNKTRSVSSSLAPDLKSNYKTELFKNKNRQEKSNQGVNFSVGHYRKPGYIKSITKSLNEYLDSVQKTQKLRRSSSKNQNQESDPESNNNQRQTKKAKKSDANEIPVKNQEQIPKLTNLKKQPQIKKQTTNPIEQIESDEAKNQDLSPESNQISNLEQSVQESANQLINTDENQNKNHPSDSTDQNQPTNDISTDQTNLSPSHSQEAESQFQSSSSNPFQIQHQSKDASEPPQIHSSSTYQSSFVLSVGAPTNPSSSPDCENILKTASVSSDSSPNSSRSCSSSSSSFAENVPLAKQVASNPVSLPRIGTGHMERLKKLKNNKNRVKHRNPRSSRGVKVIRGYGLPKSAQQKRPKADITGNMFADDVEKARKQTRAINPFVG